MKTNRRIVGCACSLLLAALLAVGGALAIQRPASDKEQKEQNENAAGFKEFMDRVQVYVNLHKSIEAGLPPLKKKEENPELITAHQQMLARKIRESRVGAKRGDIFTDEAREAFKHAIRSTFEGDHARQAKKTVRQGEPLKIRLVINEAYPEKLPYTTVPPTLLQKLPNLPDELAYRVAGRDLVLMDLKANLVVDVLREVFPKM